MQTTTEQAAALAERLVEWMREQVQEAGAAGAVVGLSGGVDSAVAGALAVRACPGAALGLIMPCHSNPLDAADAESVARAIGLPTLRVDLTPVYDALLNALEAAAPLEAEGARSLARANLKPRLRMATLYYWANRRNALVVGTGNLSELTVGYFTKYGDGGVDVLPLGGLVKAQVRALARHLGVPEPVISKAPSAGLWTGQTDEGEMGLTYDELDRFILTGEAPPEAAARIARMRVRSEHKRRLPPVAPLEA